MPFQGGNKIKMKKLVKLLIGKLFPCHGLQTKHRPERHSCDLTDDSDAADRHDRGGSILDRDGSGRQLGAQYEFDFSDRDRFTRYRGEGEGENRCDGWEYECCRPAWLGREGSR